MFQREINGADVRIIVPAGAARIRNVVFHDLFGRCLFRHFTAFTAEYALEHVPQALHGLFGLGERGRFLDSFGGLSYLLRLAAVDLSLAASRGGQ